MLTTELKIKITLPFPEPEGHELQTSLLLLILKKECKKFFAEIATLCPVAQQVRIKEFEEEMSRLDAIEYLVKQPDNGLEIIQQWDALLVEAGLTD